MAIPLQELQNINLFQELPADSLRNLAGMAFSSTFDNNQVIMLEEDEDKPVYFIQSGTVRIYRTNYEGREQTLAYLETGTVFNLPPVFSGSHRSPASAVAVGRVNVVGFMQADFRYLTSQNPEISRAVLRDLSEKLEHFTNLAHDLSLRSVRARLAHFLLEQAQASSPTETWTHEKIAAQIGTVREVVSRMMRTFIREGLIRTERQNIILLDAEKLQEEADSS